MHKHYVIKYGVYIKSDTMIGYVFYIGIWYRSSDTSNIVIGNNYNISQFLSIGSNYGTPAVIGDNVYIGSHVSIVENVKIGDNTTNIGNQRYIGKLDGCRCFCKKKRQECCYI